MPESIDAIVFYLSAIVAVVCSAVIVTRKNPVYSAVFMVLFFIAWALNFLILRAPFLAVIQVLVYGGAIMVLYLFVIMHLNLKPDEIKEEVTSQRKVLSAIASVGLFILLAWAIRTSPKVNDAPILSNSHLLANATSKEQEEVIAKAGSLDSIAMELFEEHGLPFELTSILILIAIIGAIYLTKKGKALSHDGTHTG